MSVVGYRQSWSSRLFDVFNVLLMVSMITVMVYPLLYVIATSLSSPSMITAGKVTFYPRGWNVNGYRLILKNDEVWVTYLNTVLYAGGGTVITLLLTSMIAYPMSIRDFVWKKFLTVFLSITMFFSGGLIPTYLLIRSLNLINTYWVMVLPAAIGAYNVIIFRTFFQGLPSELRESAFMDGANDVVILFRIILPLSKALLATFALFTIVMHWNSWFTALIYLTDPARYPVQMTLRKLIFETVGGFNNDQVSMQMIAQGALHAKNVQMAVVIIVMAPILCIYPFIQKYFVKGVLVGSIKG